MRLGDDAEIAKLLKELRVEMRNKPSEMPHVRHLIQLSTELRGPKGNEELESCHLEESASGSLKSGDASMSVDKWKILGVPEQRVYLQAVQDTICAVLGMHCSHTWSVEDMLNFGSTVSVAAVRVLSHGLLLAAAGALRSDVSAKCSANVPKRRLPTSTLAGKKPEKTPIASLLQAAQDPKKAVSFDGQHPPSLAQATPNAEVLEESEPSEMEEDFIKLSNMALRPDSSGNLVQVETSSMGLYPPPQTTAIVVTSEIAILPQNEPATRGRPRAAKVQQGGRTALSKKAVNEDLQDLWNFGREHAGNRKHLTDAEADQIKNGLKREARRFVRDEVDCKSRDELFELRMRHNASFRARSQAEAESAAAVQAPPTGAPARKDARAINKPMGTSKSTGALGLAGASVITRPHAQELRELMYVLKPELKPKTKKAEAAELLAVDFKGMLGGPTVKPGLDKRASVQASLPVLQPVVEEMFNFIENQNMKFSDLSRKLDQNGNGSVSMSEFLAGLKAINFLDEDTPYHSMDHCKRLFWVVDKDKSGLINIKELRDFFDHVLQRKQMVQDSLNASHSDDSEKNPLDADMQTAMSNKIKLIRRRESVNQVLLG